MARSILTIIVAGLVPALLHLPAGAQVAPADTPSAEQPAHEAGRSLFNQGTITSVSVGRLVLPGSNFALGVVGFQVTELNPGKAGPEYGLYTFTAPLREGALVISPRASAVNTTPIGRSLFLMRIGGSGTFAVTPNGGGILSLHAGVGLLTPAGPTTALRFDVEPQLVIGAPATRPIILVSAGISSLPKLRK